MGTTEIVFILLIYLLLFGTKGLPSMAQSMGKFMRQVRDAQQDIQREILSGTDDLRKGAGLSRSRWRRHQGLRGRDEGPGGHAALLHRLFLGHLHRHPGRWRASGRRGWRGLGWR